MYVVVGHKLWKRCQEFFIKVFGIIDYLKPARVERILLMLSTIRFIALIVVHFLYSIHDIHNKKEKKKKSHIVEPYSHIIFTN